MRILAGSIVRESNTFDLAMQVWRCRDAFTVPLVPPEVTVARALAASSGPVVLIDSADSTSSGASGDSTALFHALLAASPRRLVFLTLVDPEAARCAATAGVGATVRLTADGAFDRDRHRPVHVCSVVETVRNGRFTFTVGVGDGLTADPGATVVLRVGNVHLVLMEHSAPCYDPALYRHVGLEPQAAQVVVKLPTTVHWTYRDIASQMSYIDAPGVSTAHLSALRYHRHPGHPIHWMCSSGSLPLTPVRKARGIVRRAAS